MINGQLTHQKRQKILNYEIKMIEECSDSLFTETNCEHDRYLSWQLGDSLHSILKNYNYKFRWVGND